MIELEAVRCPIQDILYLAAPELKIGMTTDKMFERYSSNAEVSNHNARLSRHVI
jgi:hypothetical protein